MPAIFWLIQSAFRLVGWHFLLDEDGKMTETISIVPLSLSFPHFWFYILLSAFRIPQFRILPIALRTVGKLVMGNGFQELTGYRTVN